MVVRRGFLCGGSTPSFTTGRHFPPRWINSERIANAWKKPSTDSPWRAEAAFDRRKRVEPCPTGGGHRSDQKERWRSCASGEDLHCCRICCGRCSCRRARIYASPVQSCSRAKAVCLANDSKRRRPCFFLVD